MLCPFSDGIAVVETKAVSLVSTTISHAPLAKFWREMHGANDWEYLVQPLHPLLRSEIVRYGKLAMACYRAFDLNPASKRYLRCMYGKQNMLREAGLEDSGYEVTRYIYATPDNNMCARWIGYVAVSSDEAVGTLGRKDVLVTFRGTVTRQEWGASLTSSLTPAGLDPNDPHPDVRVESGFLSMYTTDEGNRKFPPMSCRQQLLSEVSRLVKAHAGEELSITLSGHSLGSALPALLAYDISELGLNKPDNIPVTVLSFGGPRVGDGGFKKRLHELGVKVLRIVNVKDPIPRIPGVVFNENLAALATKYEVPWSFASCHAHVGVEVVLDFFDARNPARVHDLEAYVADLLRCPEESADRVRDGAWILQNMTATLTKKLLETFQAHVHALIKI